MKSAISSLGLESPAVIFETDWLGSTPIFYNQKTGVASPKIHEVMASATLVKFDPEGLYNFLDFGYSVFGQTPVEDVQFLPPATRLLRDNDGKLTLERLPDPIERWWDYRLTEDDVIELTRERIQKWEATLPPSQEIVLPLSGGFDSRFLMWALRDKSRVRAYTYGLSEDQSQSTEVVYAKALAAHFDVRWEQVPLGNFHKFFADWDGEFGISTHAHGMYHFEFYSEIRKKLNGQKALLSGVIGDAWAGSIRKFSIDSGSDLIKLGYSHGLRADPGKLKIATEAILRDQFWLEHRDLLKDQRYQTIASMRLKMMLLSYLIKVPSKFNFDPWTPNFDIDIAMAMLNLRPERRANRLWQIDFFRKVGLDLEGKGINGSKSNSLNYQAMRRYPLPPLNSSLLSKFISSDYIEWINKNISLNSTHQYQKKLLETPRLGGILRRMGLKDSSLQAYCAYLCLKPIENCLKKELS